MFFRKETRLNEVGPILPLSIRNKLASSGFQTLGEVYGAMPRIAAHVLTAKEFDVLGDFLLSRCDFSHDAPAPVVDYRGLYAAQIMSMLLPEQLQINELGFDGDIRVSARVAVMAADALIEELSKPVGPVRIPEISNIEEFR